MEEAGPLIREMKEQHYATWGDIGVPALGGLTPREALDSPKQRERLIALLREMEIQEREAPAEARYDFRKLRRELGLEGASS
jgi:hypothetical protein